jgi:membrane protein DedA with SNARE-associated domain/uncharacterized tellurite resistance protein B-like protein
MEQLVESLAGLPPPVIYGAVAVAALIENVLPPMPSDLMVALGGFLTQRGVLSPSGLWVAAWLPNILGALGLYFLARRFGRDFLASPVGRRLIPADALMGVERGYLRFGLAGIFLSRLLPGFRSIVAPFVGLVNLSPWVVLPPMAAASAIWYWSLIWAGAKVGSGWEDIRAFIGRLNFTLAMVALAGTVLLVIWIWRGAVRRAPERRRLLRAIRRALIPGTAGSPAAAEVDLGAQSAAALLHELTHSDPQIPPEQREAITGHLRHHWRLGEQAEGGEGGTEQAHSRTGDHPVPAAFAREDRVALAERLYRIARTDGVLSEHESRIMRRAGDLLGLTADDLGEALRRSSG